MSYLKKQPWLQSWQVDSTFILFPPFFALLCVIFFPASFKYSTEMPVIYGLVLVVFIDVAHVYSTLYRTYFRSKSYQQQPLLIYIPILCYLLGVVLYLLGDLVFWRILAYLAVFHFIRQQYGFMRLYSRKEVKIKYFSVIDSLAVYAATIYPLLYWHLVADRKFNWFVEGDFLTFKSDIWLYFFTYLYYSIVILYLIKELFYSLKYRTFNLPRNLLILGTFLSWYFGIVFYNGDMAFTTLNVISHGIPYMALIWIMEKKLNTKNPNSIKKVGRLIFTKYLGIIYFIGIIIILAYLEEGLWDAFIWGEHFSFFKPFNFLPIIQDERILALLVPLLALPQATHYALDGFIWKKSFSREDVQNLND